jgi:hypothetical protein
MPLNHPIGKSLHIGFLHKRPNIFFWTFNNVLALHIVIEHYDKITFFNRINGELNIVPYASLARCLAH